MPSCRAPRPSWWRPATRPPPRRPASPRSSACRPPCASSSTPKRNDAMIRWLIAAALVAAFSCPALAQQTATGYPTGSQPFVQGATGTTSATLTVTAQTARTTYLCGISATALAGTAQSASGSVTNLLGPTGAAVTANFLLTGTMAAGSVTGYLRDHSPCMPAVAGQNVVVTTPTSTGATSTTLAVSGYFY